MQNTHFLEHSEAQLSGPVKASVYWYSQSVRMGYYFFVIATALVAQLLNPYFMNSKVWIPVYCVVVVALLFHFIVISIEKIDKKIDLDLLSLILDVFFLSAINYFTYLAYPVFIILYLINIVLASFLLGSKLSFFISGLSCLFYTICFFSSFADVQNESLPYFLNLIIFYFTAIVSGFLGDQFISKNKNLEEISQSFSELKNFSDVIIRNIGTALFTFNKNKEISFYNQSANSLFGNKLEENTLFLKNHLSKQDHQFTERKEIDLEVDNIKKNLELITTYIPDTKMESTWVTLVQDLTEIKSLQKELALKEKLAAIGQLAGGIAHEIRNPLASISGSVEMLNETIPDLSPDNKRLFAIIIREIDRLNHLITDFLSFVRPEVIKSDKVDIKFMLNEIFELLKYDKDLYKNIKVELKLQSVEILCDRGKLKQAFLNIITNGMQALAQSQDPKFECEIKNLGRFVEISFQDNGLGIPPQTLNHIFEPFYTTKAKGTGLGLAITHRIIEGHDGTIKVDSNLNKGTTFLIKLPMR